MVLTRNMSGDRMSGSVAEGASRAMKYDSGALTSMGPSRWLLSANLPLGQVHWFARRFGV
jgi:hypothetical protein